MKLIKFFWTLSGDDVTIIEKCNKKTKSRFMAIGILVASIFTLCFISFYFAFTGLFQNLWFGILIGLFFAWMIINIYLFLLHTLSKSGFPYIPNKTARFVSVGIRLVFIAFIAIIVSKPIESLVFSKQLEKEIKLFKKEKLVRYAKSINGYLDKEINDYKILHAASKDQLYLNLIEERKKEKATLVLAMEKLIDKSDYYIQSIIILNKKYPKSWAITAIIFFMFIIPAYLKIFIHKESVFYKKKHHAEYHLVKDEYELFKKKYNEIFNHKYGFDFHFYEYCYDAPFNTKEKENNNEPKEEILTEDDLLDSIYGRI